MAEAGPPPPLAGAVDLRRGPGRSRASNRPGARWAIAAQRALRPAGLWRHGSRGTRSEAGARFVERLLTVSATRQQHGRSVCAYLTDVCTAAQRGQAVPSLLPATA